jgi:cell division protein FtsN
VDKPEDNEPRTPAGEEYKTYMSPKLRSKMQFEDEPEEKGSNAANIVAIAMLLLIVVLGGIFFVSMQKSKAADKAAAAAAAKAAAAQAIADSLAKHQQDSLFAARTDSISKATPKKPKAAPAAPAATGAGGATAAQPATPPPPASKFGIDVGTFLNQDRANAEQTKLQGSTGLTAKVTPVSEGGVTSYRVVLGEFTSKAEAEKKANDLIVAQTIREAHVIKLKAGG